MAAGYPSYSLPAPVSSGEWMAVFHVYVDESGKLASKSEFTSLCGFIAHSAEWERFGELWNGCRMAWQVPPIHMAQIFRPDTTLPKKSDRWAKIREDWGPEWEERRDAMLKDLTTLIGGTGLVAVGAVVDADKYRQLHASEAVLEKTDINVFSMHTIAMRSIEKVLNVDRHGTLSIVIDDDPEHVGGFYRAVDGLRNHPETSVFGHVADRIHGVCFCNDESFPGIQAADMLAYVSRDYAVKRKGDPSTLPSALFQRMTRNGMHQPSMFTADVLEQVVKGAAEAQRIANEAKS
jgi:hypothetical protein